ncbi:hypothetical protein [Streptomyces eurythermus]|nr:hypothetical protein [Streptomyces eurythermus]MBK3521392.1 hypothetical protein [Streptomyces sp. MBT70]GGS01888.1 hypothetical protein GCM10010236_65620 [Streptomyces eurythermus]
MKLRRALSLTAATAALLPLAMAAAPASQAAPAGEVHSCHDIDTYHQYNDNTFVTRSFGVPARVKVGGQWTAFTATLTNASAKELKSFKLSAVVSDFGYVEGQPPLLPYSYLQYWDDSRRLWTTPPRDDDSRGILPGPNTLKPHESVHVQVRFRVREDLPLKPGERYDAGVRVTGTFIDRFRDANCLAFDDAGGEFLVQKD